MPTKDLPGRPLAGLPGSFKSLNKVRILDFSKLLPGPWATQLLADLGCKVTGVELPHFPDSTRTIGPYIDGVGFAYWMVHQDKKTISLDFRKPQGMKKVLGLVRRSDVLVEGFRPGLMERVGLGYEALRKLNPRLVYCSLSGYDPDGPWGRKAGHDLNFLAASGFLGLGNSEGRVAYPAAQVADLAGSHAAAIGILAALWERQSTKRGRHLKISVTNSLHSWLCLPLGQLKATGQEPKLGAEWFSGAHPFYRIYDTKDGRKLAVAALERGFSIALLDALGLSHLRDLPLEPDGDHPSVLSEELKTVFASATMNEWQERLGDKDVCVTPVYGLAEAASFLSKSTDSKPSAKRPASASDRHKGGLTRRTLPKLPPLPTKIPSS